MKASAKFLSVLLIVVMCVGFVPTAYASGSEQGIIIGNRIGSDSGAQSDTPAEPVQTAAPTEPVPAANGGIEGPGMAEENVQTYITVSSEEELRSAVKTVGVGGEVELTDDITLSEPLYIGRSLTLDLGKVFTLDFTVSGQHEGAIVIGDDVDFVQIIKGEILVGASYEDEEGVSYGYDSAICNNGNGLLLKNVTVKGGSALFSGDTSCITIEEGSFSFDPTVYIDSEEYEATQAEDGTWTVAEKAEESEPEPTQPPEETEEPKDTTPAPETSTAPEGTTDPEVTPDPEVTTNPEVTPDPEEQEGQEGQVVEPEEKDDLENPDGQTPETSPVVDGKVEVATAEDFQKYVSGNEASEVILTENIEVAASGEPLALGASIDLGGHSLQAGSILVDTEKNITVKGGTVQGTISNNGTLCLENVNAADVTNSGILTLSGVCTVNDLTVIGGEATVSGHDVTVNGKSTISGGVLTVKDSARVKAIALSGSGSASVTDAMVEGGITVSEEASLTLAGSANVQDVELSGGTLTVAEDSKVVGHDIILRKSCAINIYSGTFNDVYTGGVAFFAAINPFGSNIVVSGELLKGQIQLGTKINSSLIAPGYYQNSEFMVMSAKNSYVMGGPVKGFYQGAKQVDYVVYYKGDKVADADNTSFKFDGLTPPSVTSVVLKSDTQKVELNSGTDYTYDSKSGIVSLTENGATIDGLRAGTWSVLIAADGVTAVAPLDLLIIPSASLSSSRYVLGSSGDLTVTFSNRVDVPEDVYFGDSQDQLGRGPLLKPNQWSMTDKELTISNAYLSTLTQRDLGLRYIQMVFDGVPVMLKLTVRPTPSVSPSSTTWKYNGGDLVFTVYSADNVCNSLQYEGSSVPSSGYTIAANNRTVTVKADFLKTLVRTDTGEGHGLQYLDFVTDDGTVTATIQILPALWATDGDTHRKGSDADLTFVASAPIDPNSVPRVGDTELKSEYYTINGNRITLKAKFLNEELKVNNYNYTLTVTTIAGDASATFKTTGYGSGSSSGNPQTGDENNALVWVAVLALSGGAAVALMPRKKKQGE